MSQLGDIFQEAHGFGAKQDTEPQVQQNKKPKVMAYIGSDDPMRGDSRGAVGVAKNVAEILDGEYVYLDIEMIRDHFQYTGKYGRYFEPFKSHIKSYIDDTGMPDIIIGSHSVDLLWPGSVKPKIMETGFNEDYSETRGSERIMGLSCHDLDSETLRVAAEEFRQHYPDIKKPLIALYLGDNMSIRERAFADMIRIVNNMDEATLFVCPSRHTLQMGSRYNEVMDDLAAQITNRNVDLIGQDYESCRRDYNPYRGLIGAADHQVFMGMSQSMLSEILMSGKAVISGNVTTKSAKEMQKRGWVCSISDIAGNAFPDTRISPPNATYEIARHIAKEYKQKTAGALEYA